MHFTPCFYLAAAVGTVSMVSPSFMYADFRFLFFFIKEANSMVILPEQIRRGSLQICNIPLLHLTRRTSSACKKCFLPPQGWPECSMKLVYSVIFPFQTYLCHAVHTSLPPDLEEAGHLGAPGVVCERERTVASPSLPPPLQALIRLAFSAD